MEKQDLAIMFSGGRDSLALYALAAVGAHPEIRRPERIHLLHMLNGMGRFLDFPRERFMVAQKRIAAQTALPERLPRTFYVELDMGRLFQGLWLDWYEDLMPKYNGKNLVCVACKLAMHTRALIYCVENFVPVILAGYARRQGYFPEQTPVFMDKISEFSERFGIATRFPVYENFDAEDVTRHLLEEFGLPSTGGGETKCLFCQTKTTATGTETGRYLDDMIERLTEYVEHRLSGNIREAARCFPPGFSAPSAPEDPPG